MMESRKKEIMPLYDFQSFKGTFKLRKYIRATLLEQIEEISKIMAATETPKNKRSFSFFLFANQ